MSKLTEPQARVLRTMQEFDCPVYLSLDFYEPQSFGHCRYGGHGGLAHPGWKVARITVLGLLETGFIIETRRPGKRPNWQTEFVLTDKGREVANPQKEKRDDPG